MIQRSLKYFVVAMLPLAASGCIVVGSGWSLLTGSRVWTKEVTQRVPIEVAGVTKLEAKTHNGSIVFEGQPNDATDAFVIITKKGGGATLNDAEEALEAIEVFAERIGDDTVRIGWKWAGAKRLQWGARVSFDITAPGNLDLQGETHNGPIRVTGANGDVRVETHNGSIGVAGSPGNVWAVTYNGPVSVESARGTLYAKTHNGRIVTDYAGEDLTLITHNGRIAADLQQCRAVKGRIKTHNGGIELVVAEATSATLNCETHHGRITFDAPMEVSRVSRRKLTAKMGSGGGQLDVTTHNGGVLIRNAAG